MSFYVDMIVPILSVIVILICAYQSLFFKAKPIYFAITTLAVMVASYNSFLKTPSISLGFSIAIQLFLLCYFLYIDVKIKIKKNIE